MDPPPEGFLGWPYKKLMLEDQVVLHRLQAQIELIDKAYSPQLEDPPSDSESEDAVSESPPAAERPAWNPLGVPSNLGLPKSDPRIFSIFQ